ncbi:MAG: thioredoxin-dependent peroxiredoxin, partial [Chloroflexota bacterium]|nr:thioredoxin-dependent peroxiredoxin [Chloroflexota bacterium]
MALLSRGALAPDLEARTADGRTVRLSDLRGRHVLVYFYPRDNTPGCTAEACSLDRHLDDLGDCGADVIGVSVDSPESHRRFAEKHGLRFALASDSDRTISRAYGVGRMLGLLPLHQRVSFLVGPDGTIARVWPSVRPARHAGEVLAAVR